MSQVGCNLTKREIGKYLKKKRCKIYTSLYIRNPMTETIQLQDQGDLAK